MLPLLKKRPEIVELCQRIKDDLKRDMMAVYDDTAAIGKLYPATGRDRHALVRHGRCRLAGGWCGHAAGAHSMAQERIPVAGIKQAILDRMEAARR